MKLVAQRTKIIYDTQVDKSIYDKLLIDNLDKCYKIMISNNNKLLIDPTIIYETLIINNYKFNISRNIKTFYQIDKTIRTLVHITIFNLFNIYIKSSSSVLFIGGEMYLYGKLLNSFISNKYFYTNNEFIYRDTIINNRINSEYYLINYNKDKININKYDVLIVNISKHGLRKHLCDQINILKLKYIIMITCNENNLKKDIELLNNYRVIKQFNYITNFMVQITVLIII